MNGAIWARRSQMRLLRPVVMLGLPFLLLVGIYVVWAAANADAQRYALARELIDRTLRERMLQLQRTVEDFVWLGSTAGGLAGDSAATWLEETLPTWPAMADGVRCVVLVGSDDRPAFAYHSDGPPDLTFEEWRPLGLATLMARARAPVGLAGGRLRPQVGILAERTGSGVASAPVLAVVAPIAATSSAPEPAPLLVLTRRLDAELLGALSATASLDRVRLSRVIGPERGPRVLLHDPDERAIGALTWDMDRLLVSHSALLAGLLGLGALSGGTALALSARAAREVGEREAALGDFAASASDWLWTTDATHRVSWVSPRFFADTGLAPAAVLGRRPDAVVGVPAGGGAGGPLELDARRPFRDVIRTYRDGAGQMRLVQLAARPVCDERGVFAGYRGTASDVTERYRAEQRIRYLAEHDPLTGLLNRKVFLERLERALAAGRRSGPRAALLLFDLDDFKQVNDTLGHAAGDAVLVTLAERLRGLVRETDALARLGGDEFAVLLGEVTAASDAAAFAARLRADLSRPFVAEGEPVPVGVSIGIAMAPVDPALDGDGWLRRADLALYRAKEPGAERLQVFSSELGERRRAERQRRRDLERALERGEFELRFQPQIALRDGVVVATEVLLRWRHPTRGWIAPREFIPAAEACGLIRPIGRWVLQESCARAAAWLDAGLPFGRVAVNLSPVQLAKPQIVAEVREALAAARLPAQRLELELTEGVLVADPAASAAVMHDLAALGLRLTLDDFGKGHSSLAYLRRFPLSRLKIDRAFVGEVAVDADAAAIARAIIALGRELRMCVVAEGVETEAQRRWLVEHGCDAIQGHAVAPPMAEATWRAKLERWRDGARGAFAAG